MDFRKLITCIALLLLVAAGTAPLRAGDAAASPDTSTVVVKGTGLDAASAKEDALSNAVYETVGSIVDAETVVKNDKIITDQVLTASNGVVTAAEMVGAPQTSGKLVVVTMKVTVQRKMLTARLEKANVITQHVNGQAVAAQGDAAALTRKVFANFPGTVLKAEPVGEPKIASVSGESSSVHLKVRLSLDLDKYKQWLTTSLPVLTAVSDKAETFNWHLQDDDGVPLALQVPQWAAGATQDDITLSADDVGHGYCPKTGRQCPKALLKQDCLIVYERPGNTRATVFHLTQPAYEEMIRALASVPVMEVILKGADGAELDSRKQAALFNHYYTWSAYPYWRLSNPGAGNEDAWRFDPAGSDLNSHRGELDVKPDTRDIDQYLHNSHGVRGIFPYLGCLGNQFVFLVPAFNTEVEFKMRNDDVKAMKTVEVRVYSQNPIDLATGH